MASEVNRRVAKAMSLFTSMQALQIFCAMVRIKFITWWIGPAGVGLWGLYMTVAELIGSVTQLGIRTSAVKDVAASAGNPVEASTAVSTVRRFGVALGLLGAVVTIAMSGILSRLTFHDNDHVWSFWVIGLALFFQSLTASEQVILQGLGRLKPLASAGLCGAVGGLLLSLPLCFWLDLDGVVPSILAYAVAIWLPLALMWRHSRFDIKPVKRSLRQTFEHGRGFIKVGSLLMASTVFGYLINYVFQTFIIDHWDLTVLGFYQGGYTMLWRYAAMIFVSVGYEYYPRLTGVNRYPMRMQIMVNHQSNFTGLIMLPCVLAVIAASQLLITVLYNAEYMLILPYFVLGMAGMMLRPISVAVSYVFLVTGRGRIYCFTEIASNVIGLALNVAGFYYFGFYGLGVALILWMLADALLMVWFYYRMDMRLSRHSYLVAFALTLIVLFAGLLQLAGLWWVVAIMAAVAAVPALKALKN